MSLASKEESKSTILIADDDVTTRLLLRATISQWNYSVIEASDGEEAWQILQAENSPQIATIDWMMPKLDGIDLCRRAKTLAKPPYIILLTSMSGSANSINALDSGADDFLTKPFNYMELRSRLHVGQRIVNFTHKLESIIEEQKDYYHPNLKEFTLIAEKMCIINNQLKKKWGSLENQIQNIGSSNLQEQLELKNLAHRVYLDQQQLTEEITSLIKLLENQHPRMLNTEIMNKKANHYRDKDNHSL